MKINRSFSLISVTVGNVSSHVINGLVSICYVYLVTCRRLKEVRSYKESPCLEGPSSRHCVVVICEVLRHLKDLSNQNL